MNVLVDENLPETLADWIVSKGGAAVHARRQPGPNASDHALATFAANNDLVLMTKDVDFLLVAQQRACRIIWLRIGNATTRSLIDWLEPRWADIAAAVARGDVVIEVR